MCRACCTSSWSVLFRLWWMLRPATELPPVSCSKARPTLRVLRRRTRQAFMTTWTEFTRSTSHSVFWRRTQQIPDHRTRLRVRQPGHGLAFFHMLDAVLQPGCLPVAGLRAGVACVGHRAGVWAGWWFNFRHCRRLWPGIVGQIIGVGGIALRLKLEIFTLEHHAFIRRADQLVN